MANLAAEVVLEWADGEYLFALKAKQIEELEHLCDEGIGRIAARVFSRVDYRYKHLRETIRLGLIGGGTPPIDANRLVTTYVDGQPIDPTADKSSTLKTASAVLQAMHFGWEGLPETQPGEAESPEPKSTSGLSEPVSPAPVSRRARGKK